MRSRGARKARACAPKEKHGNAGPPHGMRGERTCLDDHRPATR
ncbi:Hypothetical protein A7982_10035 [Minicystis rosea]|nr:Hypothetical protein A7982_10035 [Minicystis rosea]